MICLCYYYNLNLFLKENDKIENSEPYSRMNLLNTSIFYFWYCRHQVFALCFILKEFISSSHTLNLLCFLITWGMNTYVVLSAHVFNIISTLYLLFNLWVCSVYMKYCNETFSYLVEQSIIRRFLGILWIPRPCFGMTNLYQTVLRSLCSVCMLRLARTIHC
jgi:hypothetical protein